MARLTSRFWVDAYMARLRQQEIPVFVIAHGDDTAGSLLIKLNTLDGCATLFQRGYDLLADKRSWAVLSEGAEKSVDEMITRQRGFDPDLWVLEVEDRQGRHLLDSPGLD